MAKKLLAIIFCVFSFQALLFAQAPGTTPCTALQLYPYTGCGNSSGMQYAGHYQTEMGDGIQVTMTGTSTINPACTTDNETSQSVEWLAVTATTTSFTITNQTDYAGPGAATAETRDYVIYSGSCSALTQIQCAADIPRSGTVNVTGLTAGQTYYIMVSQSSAAFSGYPAQNGVVTCITSTVPHTASNDNCAGAFVLANNVTYTVTNADSTADGPSVCQDPPSGSVENNVWYQWCAPSTWTPGQNAFLNINNQVCNSTQGLQLSIYDAATTCAQITSGTASSLVCQNPGATTNYNYTFTANPNQCYLIVLDGFAGTACTYSIQVSAAASTCVTPPTVTATAVTPTLCPTGSTVLNAACAGNCTGITYTWSPATGLSGTTGASVTATPAVTTTYTVTGTTATCTASATVTVTVNPLNTIAAGSNQTVCINSPMTTINLATTGATGATFSGLPAGVSGSWAGNVATISGTPTASGTFNYTVTTTGGCPPATATGTITVNPINTIAAGTSQTVCINTAISNIVLATTGATGATFSGLPAGVSGSWAANVVTISGTPTASGTFNYTVTTTGGCPPATATGTITVSPQNTIAAGTSQTVCVNTAITNIVLATTGATGATFSGLPAGVSGSWAANVVTISGTPTASGTFNYTVTTTGGCPPATATGTITVTPQNSIDAGTSQTVCINTAITNIVLATTGATGATFSGLPAGVSGSWAANVVTISGTPTASGTFNYTVTTTGGCPPATATGTITVSPQNTIAAGTSQTVCINSAITNIVLATTGATGATFSGLPAGVSGSWAANVVTISGTPTASGTFNYTVTTTGGCPPATATGTITVTPQNTIDAGTSQAVCINTAITNIVLATTGATGATFSGLPAGVSGSWAANVVTISGTPTASGTFNYTVTTTGGCPPATATGTITVSPQNTIAAGTSQTVCINSAITNIVLATTGATGATFSGLPAGVSGSWAANVVTISGTPTVSGIFNYTVTTTGGCPPATATGTITVTPQNTIDAGTSQTVCINTAITNIVLATTGATGATFSGLPTGVSGSWAANVVTISGTPTASGTFNYTVTTTGGCPPATATGTITVDPSIVPTFAAVTPICNGDSLSALPTTSTNGVGGTWSPALDNTTTTVYTFTPTAGQCASNTTLTITVNPLPATPTASVTVQPTCMMATGTITVTAPLGGGLQYSVDGVTYQAGTSFGSLVPGTYNVTVQNTVTGCISPATTLIINTAPGAPATPNALVTTQPTCTTPTGTILVTSPTGATLEYSIDGVTFQASTTFTGVAPGTYNLTVRDTGSGCSAASSVIVNPVPADPAAPTASATVQPTCTVPTGTLVVTVPTGASYEYSIDGTTYQAGTTFAGLTPGSYNVTVRDMSTGCVSVATVVIINALPANPAAPTASTTVQPTCTAPTGTIVVTAPAGASIQYSVDGVTYQASGTFSGLTPGNYNVTATDTATGCTSSITVITVDPIPANPAAPTASVTVQPTCTTPTGTITITAPTSASLQYSTDGVTYQASAVFSGMLPGTYNVIVQDTATGCVSAATSVTVNPIPANPAAPTASVTFQPTCSTTTGTIVVTAPSGASIQYSIDGVTYQSSATFAGLTPGSYNITATDTSTGCISSATSVTVNAIPANPAAPTATVVSPATCASPTGSITVTAPTGATLEYTIDGITYQSGTAFAALTPGTYNVSVRDTATGCVSSASSFTVNPVPGAPAAPTASTTFQPTCTTPTGTIVVTAPLGATLEYSVDGITYQASTTFAGLVSGSYSIGVRDTVTGCLSSVTTVVVDPITANPAAPTASATQQPTCTIPTGSLTITAPLGATFEYSADGVTYQSGTTFTGLASGTYAVTVRDTTTGCVSSATSVTIDPITPAPAAPTASTTFNPTCATPTGTIVFTAPIGATSEYSIDGTTYQAGVTFSGLASGTYMCTVRDTATGCVSSATAVTVNPITANPAAPTSTVLSPLTCAVTTGSITVTAPIGANFEYSVDGVTFQSGTVFSGLVPGTYNVSVRDTSTGCVSTATTETVNPAPGAPAAATASVTVQPSCIITTGTIVVTAPTGASLEYSINGTTYQPGTTFTGLTPATYSLTVRDIVTGCVSNAVPLTVNPLPANPVAPTAAVTIQPTCSVPSGTIEITAPSGANLEYSIDGTTYQASMTFTMLAPGNYNVSVRDTVTGCTSSSIMLTVDPVPSPVSVTVTQGCVNGSYTLTASPNNSDYLYEWLNSGGTTIGTNNSVIVTVAGMYTVEVTTPQGCVTTEPLNVITPFCEIPKGISPNGDSLNDSFDIAGLNANNVGIFNRYGVQVYSHGSGYTDQWHGQSSGGQELPDGTYYYVIDTADGQTRTGWVYINRER